MNKEEIIKAFKLAEKHWSRPEWLCVILGFNGTTSGFCNYFSRQGCCCILCLQNKWIKYRTTESYRMYHFNSRKERLQAIRNILKDLKS